METNKPRNVLQPSLRVLSCVGMRPMGVADWVMVFIVGSGRLDQFEDKLGALVVEMTSAAIDHLLHASDVAVAFSVHRFL